MNISLLEATLEASDMPPRPIAGGGTELGVILTGVPGPTEEICTLTITRLMAVYTTKAESIKTSSESMSE